MRNPSKNNKAKQRADTNKTKASFEEDNETVNMEVHGQIDNSGEEKLDSDDEGTTTQQSQNESKIEEGEASEDGQDERKSDKSKSPDNSDEDSEDERYRKRKEEKKKKKLERKQRRESMELELNTLRSTVKEMQEIMTSQGFIAGRNEDGHPGRKLNSVVGAVLKKARTNSSNRGKQNDEEDGDKSMSDETIYRDVVRWAA